MRSPCGMMPRLLFGSKAECGKMAEVGWSQEDGTLVPICEDCIAWTGQERKYLKHLATPFGAAKPQAKREGEA